MASLRETKQTDKQEARSKKRGPVHAIGVDEAEATPKRSTKRRKSADKESDDDEEEVDAESEKPQIRRYVRQRVMP